MEKKKWYVRNTAGKVFGPIDFDSLKAWVKDGRVEPLAGVSSDLKHWLLAPLKPELEMNWIVENNPGQFYGPTHRSVVDDLVKTGTLSPAARFYVDDRGAALERIRALEGEIAARDSERVQKDSSLAEAQKLSAKKDLQLAAAQKAIRERDDRLSEAKSQLVLKDTQIAELTKNVQLRDGQLQQAAAEIARRDVERQALDAEIARRDAEIAVLKEQLSKRDEVHEREWKTEVVVPEVVANEMPPPVARQAFTAPVFAGGASASALADLERRAQQELARMGAAGAKKFFRMKK
ncbi:MAG: hypothetical protein IJJ84_03705 [Kiritimatiellae bacterium]|nr:hypothetical protein [Kiritimatiellia bacterium]